MPEPRNARWIEEAASGRHRGYLHRAVGVPEGEPIPDAALAKAARSSNPRLRAAVVRARTLERLGKHRR